MASTADERLALFLANYQRSAARRPGELKAATNAADVDRILAVTDDLEAKYLDAAQQALDATGPDVEAAYQAALAATQAVEHAYAQGKALADRIRAVAGAATALGNLLTKAAGAAA
jgi:hypothetical protein